MDVLEQLMNEHRQVEELLSRLADAEQGERGDLLDELERSLDDHMALEEQHVYPLVEQTIDAETEQEAQTEHDLARQGLAQLRELQDKPGFGAAVDMLTAGIAHHVREEEDEVFPRLRQDAADQLDQLDPTPSKHAEAVDEADEADGRPRSGASGGATKEELYEQAKEAGIEGRSSMTKDQLEAALDKR